MNCFSLEKFIPDNLNTLANLLGYKEVCTPEWLGTVVQWSKLDLVSFEELTVLFRYLLEKGIIYIQ